MGVRTLLWAVVALFMGCRDSGTSRPGIGARTHSDSDSCDGVPIVVQSGSIGPTDVKPCVLFKNALEAIAIAKDSLGGLDVSDLSTIESAQISNLETVDSMGNNIG